MQVAQKTSKKFGIGQIAQKFLNKTENFVQFDGLRWGAAARRLVNRQNAQIFGFSFVQNAELVKFPKIFVHFAQLSLKKWTNLCAFCLLTKNVLCKLNKKLKKYRENLSRCTNLKNFIQNTCNFYFYVV